MHYRSLLLGRALGPRARNSVPGLNGQLLNQGVLFVDACLEGVIAELLIHTGVPKSLRHGGLQVLCLGLLGVDNRSGRALLH